MMKFKVDDTIYNSQIITKNGYATLPTTPTKTGYEFDGWSLNGVDVISDITTKQVTENTTYVAVFTKLHTVTFIYENETKSTQIIRNGKFATTVNIDNTDYKIFNGWKINDTIVDLSTYKIVADTTFIADITYKYDVIFKVDNTIYNSQIVAKNGYATLPTNPTKDGYEFDGWSFNGVDVITDITTKQVIENTTYVAVFTKLYTVKFMNGDIVVSTQFIRNGEYATLPNNPIKDNYRFVGWSLNGVDILSDIDKIQVTENTTYIVVFEKITYTVTFVYLKNYYGSSAGNSSYEENEEAFNVCTTIEVDAGETVSEPSIDFGSHSYQFRCWCLDINNLSYSSSFDFNTPITENIVLYAYFVKERV